TLPFAVLLATVARAPFPDWLPRALATTGIALASLFAAVGLWQAATHKLFFFAPNLAVSNANTDFFRVTSLFGDPSLYGRHVVLGIGVALALLAARRSNRWLLLGALVVMWAGLLFSYSQSSMAALLVVTLGIAFAAGDRGVRRSVALVGLAAALAAAAYAGIQVAGGESLNQLTSDRTDRVETTMRVVRDEPLLGVGIGGQPDASRRLAESEQPTASFVSHTTPLAVAAELGLVGLALYAWLLVGGVRLIVAAGRRDQALGLALGAALGALFVHALFYSGFVEDPLTWLVLAIAAGYLAGHPRTPAERAAERRAARERPAAVAR
ncbi:MAG TPA: O-antigen ligase family protein, partial [Thermoleophilaceae bacterium]|nr:O-antigen ligase family protein [Thermoleophilaceae bacterium]